MAYERKDGDGVLFRNEKKQNDKQPDYTGSALINGEEHTIAAWVKEAKSTGKKFFSLSIQPRDLPQRGQGSQARSAPERSGGTNSSRWGNREPDLPF